MCVAPAAASTQLSLGLPFSDIDFSSTPPQISPDGQYAVYAQDAVIDSAFELWSVRLDNATLPVRLSDTLIAANSDVTFAISPDSTRVVYLVDQDTLGAIELYSVPIDGSAARVRLNGVLASAGDVLSFAISPDSARVVYLADQNIDTLNELFSVPITGGATTRLNRTMGACRLTASARTANGSFMAPTRSTRKISSSPSRSSAARFGP